MTSWMEFRPCMRRSNRDPFPRQLLQWRLPPHTTLLPTNKNHHHQFPPCLAEKRHEFFGQLLQWVLQRHHILLLYMNHHHQFPPCLAEKQQLCPILLLQWPLQRHPMLLPYTNKHLIPSRRHRLHNITCGLLRLPVCCHHHTQASCDLILLWRPHLESPPLRGSHLPLA